MNAIGTRKLIASSNGYKLWQGKLDRHDSRDYYATKDMLEVDGNTPNAWGAPHVRTNVPVASFYYEGEGLRWLRERAQE